MTAPSPFHAACGRENRAVTRARFRRSLCVTIALGVVAAFGVVRCILHILALS
jgi:hypothetical protein